MSTAINVGGDQGGGGSSGLGNQQGSTAGSGGSTAGSTGTGTITSSGGSTAGITFAWNEKWRDELAAGDAKTLARLGRFNSPGDIWRSYLALEQRMSTGELKSALKPDATDAEKAAWRTENGIPDKPEGYDLTFADGTVIGEEDKPMVDAFLKSAHAANMTPAQVKQTLAWYYDHNDTLTEQQATKDTEVAQKAQDTLRGKWGNEYRANMNATHGLLDQAPAGFKDKFLNGRLADGTPIGSSVEGLEWIAHLARQLNPMGTIVPAGGASGADLAKELATIEAKMGNRNSDYWKGAKDANGQTALQARYKELITYQQAQQGGKKAA